MRRYWIGVTLYQTQNVHAGADDLAPEARVGHISWRMSGFHGRIDESVHT